MLPDRVSNPGPLTYESGDLPIALRGPALILCGQDLNFRIILKKKKKRKKKRKKDKKKIARKLCLASLCIATEQS